MITTFPGESTEYRTARDRLLEQEIALRRAMEAVAVARRQLPPGGAVPEDYVFQGAGPDGCPTDVRMSELFRPGTDTLVVYNFMFPRDRSDDRPGPARGRSALLPILESPCPSCTALLDQIEGAAEHVAPHLSLVNVFQRHAGTVRHFWGSELFYAPTDPGQEPRHVGTIEPLWNLLDFTPGGRPSDWDEQLSYSERTDEFRRSDPSEA